MPGNAEAKTQRFIYRTEGVCPKEIHFQIREERLRELRFVGGGCPGNARLAGRLLEGAPVEEALEKLEGIDCRNDTSCPDQLARALRAVRSGTLAPAESFRLERIDGTVRRIALVGPPGDCRDVWRRALAAASERGPDAVVCLGDLTHPSADNEEWIRTVRGQDARLLQGERDWLYACRGEPEGWPPLSDRRRDGLLRLPQVLGFRLEGCEGIAVSGDFVQRLPGYSDYEPFALEMNMVFSMTRSMQDDSVFPALEAMTPQFSAGLVVFAQGGDWGHWRVGGVDFVRVGALEEPGVPRWGLLESRNGALHLETVPLD